MAISHAQQHWFDEDPEMRHSLRVIRRDRRGKQVAVLFGFVAALAIAFAYAYLSYSDTADLSTPVTAPR